MRRGFACSIAGMLLLLMASPLAAQVRLNQADPSIIERALPTANEPAPIPDRTVTTAPETTVSQSTSAPRVASAIVIEGGPEIDRAAFGNAIMPYLGRALSTADLTQLAGAVAGVARDADFPFASAWIEPQMMAAGVLRVRLDTGALAAVRVIGASNTLADQLLTRALVTGHAVRGKQLERAILLVSDIPGVSVKDSKYIRQDGFGILLVTISTDPASLYLQFDNRGSEEVGPVRSTILASLRGVAQPGDELSLIAAQTPFQLSEFFFFRGRYGAPVGSNGAVLTASGSYGRARPGASLAPLNVIGDSFDAAVTYATPLFRSRTRSVWSSVEFRSLTSSQTLLGGDLRNDRLTTLTGSVYGSADAVGGTLRAALSVVAGLPLPGVTHEGDPLRSRSDGDARFVTWGYEADWTKPLAPRVSFVLASQGQLASRPLLATAEIGAGGPTFGRGYDYSERTGDKGILGSGELRFDLNRLIPAVNRLQLYGSVDGGYVGNLRSGKGGGALLSAAAGIRAGRGRLSGMLELALPLNEDRFDTGNRRPRFSFRISRLF